MKKFISGLMILLFAMIFPLSANALPGDLFVQVNLLNGLLNCSILRVTPDSGLFEFISSQQIKDVTGEGAVDCDNTGLAIDRDGNVYFNEDESDSVLVATPDGDLSIFVPEAAITALTGLANADLDNGMTIGLDGNLYFADEEGFVLRATIPDGVVSLVLTEAEILAVTGKTEVDLQGGIAFDCSGNLYITDEESLIAQSADLILKLTPGGVLSIFVTEDDILSVTGGSSTDLDVAANFFVDSLYVLDDGDCDCVLKIDLNGNIEEFVTSQEIENVTGGGADLEGGLAINQSETLFIGDDGSPDSPNILRVTQAPVVSIFVSTAELEAFYPGFQPRLQGSMAIEGVDVCFIPQIPTLSEWGLIAMAGILGIVGFMVMRRRKVTA